MQNTSAATEKPSAVSLDEAILDAYRGSTSERIFALMGPNGAGKSRKLLALREMLKKQKIACLHLPSVRHVPNLSSLGHFPTIRQYSVEDFQEFWNSISNDLISDSLRQRIEPPMRPALTLDSALAVLLSIPLISDRQKKVQYKEDLYAWKHSGQVGPIPEESPSIVDRIQEKISKILGYDTVISEKNSNQFELTFKRDNHTTFNTSGLSDGEKQLLFISILLMGINETKFVFLVDEPELYLNEARAVEIWEKLEEYWPSAVFLYATHNIAFATRLSIDRAYLIGHDGITNPVDLSQPVQPSVIRYIVGARIQILRTSAPIVFCEGELDELIIRDIFADAFHPLPVNGWYQVRAAVLGEHAWRQVRSMGVGHCGIIDRDTRDAEACRVLEEQRIFCLPLYDAESLLLTPEIASWSLTVDKGQTVPPADYLEWLIDAARLKLRDMIDLTAKQLESSHAPILTYKYHNESGLNEPAVEPPSGLVTRFVERVALLREAVETKASLEILRLFKGKLLYPLFYQQSKRRFGVDQVDSALQKYRSMRRHAEFRQVLDTVPWVADFREKVKGVLTQPRL